MTSLLKTERLILRPLRRADAPAIAGLISDWDVIRWLTTPPWPYRLQDAEEFLASDAAAEARAVTNGKALLGVASILDRSPGLHELGYWLGRPYWGQGYATEAVGALIDAHFAAGQDKLYAGVLPGNAASARVLARLGFEPAGHKQAMSRPLGREVEVCRNELTASRWAARHDL